MHEIATEGKPDKQTLRDIQALIEAHPDHPQLYNLLVGAYQRMGKSKKARAVSAEVLARFPDYLFAWVNQGLIDYLNGDPQTAAARFKGRFEIGDHLPRQLVHVSEGSGFYTLACLVHAHEQRAIRAAYAFSQMMHTQDPDDLESKQITLCLKNMLKMLPESEMERLRELGRSKLRKLR